jgi:phosphoheptose isomerase
MLPIESFKKNPKLWGYFGEVADALHCIDQDEIAEIAAAIELVNVPDKGLIWVIGNGGSQANAQHLVLHLRQSGFPAIDLMADNAWLTAESNDTDYHWAVERVTRGLPTPSMLIMISGSGNSVNLEAAISAAQVLNHRCIIVGLLGMIADREGGHLAADCDHKVVVQSDDYGVVEDVHSSLVHFIHRALTTA